MPPYIRHDYPPPLPLITTWSLHVFSSRMLSGLDMGLHIMNSDAASKMSYPQDWKLALVISSSDLVIYEHVPRMRLRRSSDACRWYRQPNGGILGCPLGGGGDTAFGCFDDDGLNRTLGRYLLISIMLCTERKKAGEAFKMELVKCLNYSSNISRAT